MCIYYSQRSGLHYERHEHVIPAAIGGILELPKGVVSDEFNLDISSLELHFIREWLSIPRQLVGPGKRGSLNPKDATKSNITILSNPKSQENYALGYVILGKPYEIPHIILNTSTGEMSMNVPGGKGNAAFDDFKKNVITIGNSQIKVITDNSLPTDIILFGIDENSRTKYKYFFSKNEANPINPSSSVMYELFKNIEMRDQNLNVLNYQPKVHSKHTFDLEHFRICGKIAINYLAHLKGKEHVLGSQFDDVRNWIAYGGDNNFATWDKLNTDPIAKVLGSSPEHYHFISIRKVDNLLVANVLLYAPFMATQIILSKDFQGNFNPESFICDWKNQKEFGLMEYLATELHKQETA